MPGTARERRGLILSWGTIVIIMTMMDINAIVAITTTAVLLPSITLSRFCENSLVLDTTGDPATAMLS